MAGSLPRKYTPNHTKEIPVTGKITLFIALLSVGEREGGLWLCLRVAVSQCLHPGAWPWPWPGQARL